MSSPVWPSNEASSALSPTVNSPWRHRGAALVALILLVIGLATAISVDVVRANFGMPKGDEATYVTMALSAAYDYDVRYERRDLERFWSLYRRGPEGIFLKRGQQWHFRLRGSPPYVRLSRQPDQQNDRLYFGKPLVYSVTAAPFVRLFGLNGFLVLHVVLLFIVGLCAYVFLVAQSPPGPALLFALAFLGATVVPVYTVFLTPEIFNFALVFVAYFLWLYKEVAPRGGSRVLRGRASDLCAAMLLAAATYSKPSNALLIAPIVLFDWWRRRFAHGVVTGVVFVMMTVGLFGVNALTSGEFNYQGGDRKTFYEHFPFDSPTALWDNRELGISMSTNDADTENVLEPSEFVNRFGLNVKYFLIGRNFGFVPYYFPGVVAIGLWLASRERTRAWRLLTFAGLVGSACALLVLLPFTWSGGGGPPGNRYFLSIYPTVFFLIPPLASIAPAVLAWVGGALFTAKMIVNPFVAAKYTYETVERGFARRLPVELTMANDLPIMLDYTRSRVPYGSLLLYFLDQHAYTPDPGGIWVAADGRADILFRSDQAVDHLRMTVDSPVRTTFEVSVGGAIQSVRLAAGQTVTLDVPTYGVRGLDSYAYLLSVRSSDGFIPRLNDPNSKDSRNLGVLMRFTPIETAAGQ